MSDIDKIFKNGLDGKSGGMEYSTESWAAMEQMLDSKKIGFWARYKNWIGVLALVTAFSGMFYWATLSDKSSTNLNAKRESLTLENNTAIAPNSNESGRSNDWSARGIQNSAKPAETSDNKAAIESKSMDTAMHNLKTKSKTAKFKEPHTPLAKFIDENTQVTGTYAQHTGYISTPLYTHSTSYTEDKTETSYQNILDYVQTINLKSIPFGAFNWNVNEPKSLNINELKTPNKRKYAYVLSPYAGFIDYSKKLNFPSNVLDENNNLLESQTKTSYVGGLNFGVKLGNWVLSTGVGKQTLNEQTNYKMNNTHTKYEYALRVINHDYASTPRGTRVVQVGYQKVDSSTTTVTTSICENCEASFEYITIPVNLQYNVGKRRLRYFAEAGVTMSFLQKANGQYALLNTDSTGASVVNVSELSTSDQLEKRILYANAALGAKYWLSPKWSVWTSYGYGLGLNSMFSSYEQKPSIQNYRVGLEFKLN
jgi:hypothetical protein